MPHVDRFKLRALRKSQGLTQAKLAEALGLLECSVHKWESGRHRPSSFNLALLCRILGCEPGDLLEDEQPPASPRRETGKRSADARGAAGGVSDGRR